VWNVFWGYTASVVTTIDPKLVLHLSVHCIQIIDSSSVIAEAMEQEDESEEETMEQSTGEKIRRGI